MTFATELTLDSQDPAIESQVWRDPTIEQVERAIRLLDQGVHTEVTLDGQGSWFLLIGGGSGAYTGFIENAVSGERHQLLNQQAAIEGTISVVAGGQTGSFAADHVVGLDQALQAARHFADVGGPDPALSWSDEQSA